MKNIVKIALISIVCLSKSFAVNSFVKPILITTNVIHYAVSSDTIKNGVTSSEKTDPKKKSLVSNKNEDDIFIDEASENYIIKQLVHVATDNLGIVYRSGGTSKNGFDCSGLVYSTFNTFSVKLPRTSYQMADVGSIIEPLNAKKGDLIFFGTKGKKRINHVGMITEVCGDEIKFIHSSTHGGVIISSNKETYYKRTFAQINRVLY